jgi:hypothetical protein
MPAFDIINNTSYEINDWAQLVGLKSNLSEDVKIAVNSYNCDIIDCTAIVIYMESKSVPLTSFVISGTDSGAIKSSLVEVSKDSALKILNAFGFPVEWVSKWPKLTPETVQLLADAKTMGFAYVVKQHQNQVVFYSTDKKSKTLLANELPVFAFCDFSEFETMKFYSIEKLINEASAEDQEGIEFIFDGGSMEGDFLS